MTLKKARKKRISSAEARQAIETVAALLMSDMVEKGLGPGAVMPSCRSLMSVYSISYKTAFQVYSYLKERGRVESKDRSGMILRDTSLPPETAPRGALFSKGIYVVGFLQTEHPAARFNSNSQVLRVIEEECLKSGIPIHFYNLRDRIELLEGESKHDDFRILSDNIDEISALDSAGMLLMFENSSADSVRNEIFSRLRPPFVSINDRPGLPASVASDEFEAGRKATCHLLELGHRKIAFLAFDVGHSWMEDRIEGYRSAFAEYGIPRDSARIERLPYNIKCLEETIKSKMCAVLPSLHYECTAVLCGSDAVGKVLLDFELENSITKEESLSFVTFDDDWEFRQYDMTSVRRAGEVQAKAAFNMLLRMVSSPGLVPDGVKVSGNLYVRGTSRPAPSIKPQPAGFRTASARNSLDAHINPTIGVPI